MLVCDNVLLQEPALLARLKLFLSCVQKPPSAAISASPVTLLTLLLMMFWKHTPALTPALVRVQISSFHNGFISVSALSALQSAVSLFYDVFQVILAQGSKRATDFPTMWYQSVTFYVNEMFLSFVFPGFVFLPSSWNFPAWTELTSLQVLSCLQWRGHTDCILSSTPSNPDSIVLIQTTGLIVWSWVV